jgi:hypothetical protein
LREAREEAKKQDKRREEGGWPPFLDKQTLCVVFSTLSTFLRGLRERERENPAKY